MNSLTQFLNSQDLTETQITIVDMITRGHLNVDIATIVETSEAQLKLVITEEIYPKMKCTSRAQVVVACLPYLLSE